MFIILEGGAEVWQQPEGGSRVHLRSLGPGEMFGEIALVCASPRSADVVAAGETRALALEWDRVQQLGRLFPGITSKLSLNLAAVIGRRLACTPPSSTSAPAASSG
jgi:CRP-like cAMP-binding protein